MKVCTDSCIFGSLLDIPSKSNVLDIGAGTGLLSLMAAQKCDGLIKSIEIDYDAAKQSFENFQNSPWKNRLNVIHDDIRNLDSEIYLEQYDSIISNPPFYENHLLPSTTIEQKAKHTTTLNYNDLLKSIIKLLKPNGVLNILLPFSISKEFIILSENYNLKLFSNTSIKNFENSIPFRSVLKFTFSKNNCSNDEIVIYKKQNEYTETIKALLKDYYLYL
jgi:tRNA1Val (adenine37-N6)-methyltransferase